MILYNCVIFTMNDQKTVIENGYIEIDLGKIKKIGEGMPENITDELIEEIRLM